ncbi:MAG: hypothetical protein Q9193_004981, partial [Seirophora villosa]
MATMDYETENGRYEDEPRYERDRSASPRPVKRDDDYGKRDDGYRGGRDRSASPNDRMDSRGPAPDRGGDDRGDRNPGSNLFVTGIHPRLNEADVTRLFEKYGDVEGCSIMKDPHTQESRGFGFVKMVTAEQADAAKEGLQGENIEGRTLSIEKARRSRPRTPTPGKYFGPPKRGKLKTYCSCPVIFANVSQTMCAALLLGEVVATEATTAMMTAVVGVMAAADMVEEDVMMTPTVLHATTTAAMDVVMITDQEASIAMLPAAMTATAAVETIDVAGLTTIVVMADVAMAETLLLREIHTAEVGATMTVTI